MRAVMEHPCFDYLTYSCILANLVLVIVQSSNPTASQEEYGTFFVLEAICVSWFLLEMLIKVTGLGLVPYVTDGWHLMDGVLTICSLAGIGLQVVTWEAEVARGGGVTTLEGSGSLRALRVLRVMRMARTISILSHTKSLRAISETFLQVLPMFYALLAVLLLLSNVWASVGVEVFGSHLRYDPLADCNPVCGTYDSWPNAMLSMTQVWLGNGWVSLMYTTMASMHADGWSVATAWWASSIYYTSFFFAVNVVLTNLLGALVIEIYIVETEKSKRERENEQALSDLFSCSTCQASASEPAAVASGPPSQPSCGGGGEAPLPRREAQAGSGTWASLDDAPANPGALGGSRRQGSFKPKVAQARRSIVGGVSAAALSLNDAIHQGNGPMRRASTLSSGSKSRLGASHSSLASSAPPECSCREASAGSASSGSGAKRSNRRSTYARAGVYDASNFERPMEVAEILTDSVHAKFSKYDTSHAGVISTSDCASLLRELGESTVDAASLAKLTEELDADGSGLIDFREFLDWWQHHGMQRVFMRFDHDKSGSIDTHELSELLASLGLRLTPQQLQAAQSLLDPDGDGSISWAEYLKWWERFDVQRIFERYDADGSGAISARELQLLCADLGVHLSKREVKDALKKLDKDGSATLSFEEFFPWWCAISDLKCDSKLVVDYKGGRWEDNLFLHVDKLNQLKGRQRKQLKEAARELGLGPLQLELLSRRLELDAEEALFGSKGGGLNQKEVQAQVQLKKALATGQRNGVETALMMSREVPRHARPFRGPLLPASPRLPTPHLPPIAPHAPALRLTAPHLRWTS